MSENITNTIPTENTAICEHCGMKVKADAQFCSSCGKPVIAKPTKIFCQTCGSELEDGEMFCPKCGSSSSANKNAEALNNIAEYNASLNTAITQKPKKKKVWKVLLIILGVIMALMLVGYFVILPEYNYQEACDALKRGSYSYAISCFEDLGDYKDSKTKISESKYRYVNDNLDNSDYTTYEYLKDLKYESYKDSSEIFEDLYSWRVTIEAINSSEDDSTTNKESISKHKPVFCHFILEGGEPGESVRLQAKASRPNGSDSEYTFDEEWSDGQSGWYGWEDGIYAYPEYGAAGNMQFRFYNYETGELLGSGSVRITN